jgi:uncharacterized protein (DUF433 family)
MPTNGRRLIVESQSSCDPAEAVLVEFEIPVWAIIGQLKALNWDVQRVANDYDVSEDSVTAAVDYYRKHAAAIDARLQANLPAPAI